MTYCGMMIRFQIQLAEGKQITISETEPILRPLEYRILGRFPACQIEHPYVGIGRLEPPPRQGTLPRRIRLICKHYLDCLL